MAKTKSVIRKGPSSGGGSKDFIILKADDKVTVVPVLPTSEIMSIDVHGFWEINPAVTFACLKGSGEECPGCEAGNEASYRAFLPVLDGDGELKVFPFGIGIERKMVALEDELGEIVGLKLRVTRTGSGLKTRYEVMNTGKREEVDVDEDEAADFVRSRIEVKSEAQAREELEAAGLLGAPSKKAASTDDDDEEEEETPRAKAKAGKAGKIGKASKADKPVKKGKKASDDEWED